MAEQIGDRKIKVEEQQLEDMNKTGKQPPKKFIDSCQKNGVNLNSFPDKLPEEKIGPTEIVSSNQNMAFPVYEGEEPTAEIPAVEVSNFKSTDEPEIKPTEIVPQEPDIAFPVYEGEGQTAEIPAVEVSNFKSTDEPEIKPTEIVPQEPDMAFPVYEGEEPTAEIPDETEADKEEINENKINFSDLTQFDTHREYTEAYLKSKGFDKAAIIQFYEDRDSGTTPSDYKTKEQFTEERLEQIRQAEVTKAQNETYAAETEIGTLQSKLDSALRKIERLETEKDDAEQSAQDAANDNLKLKEEIRDSKRRIETLDEEIKKLQEQIDSLNRQLTRAQNTIADLNVSHKNKIAALKQGNEEEIKNIKKQLEEERKSHEQDNKEKDGKIEKLGAQLQNIGNTLDGVQKDDDPDDEKVNTGLQSKSPVSVPIYSVPTNENKPVGLTPIVDEPIKIPEESKSGYTR